MGEQERAGDQGQAHEADRAATTAPHHVVEHEVAAQHEQHHQRVHAGLGGVAQRERGEGQHRQGQPAQPVSAAAAPRQVGQRQRRHREHARERSHGDVALAEHLHPAVEHPVVEGRVTVVAQRRPDVAQRERRDVDAQRLVEPQRRSGDEPQHQTERDRSQRDGLDPDGRGLGRGLLRSGRTGGQGLAHGPRRYRLATRAPGPHHDTRPAQRGGSRGMARLAHRASVEWARSARATPIAARPPRRRPAPAARSPPRRHPMSTPPDAATAEPTEHDRHPDDGAGAPEVVVVGAGPAGLTAAYQLVKRGVTPTVIEADAVVGGISRTAQADGWRFDIGGHRFFTKVQPVEDLWHEILADDEFLSRPRMSRIYYQGKYYDYPIKPLNALRNLGLIEATRCVLSYLWVKVHPPKDRTSSRATSPPTSAGASTTTSSRPTTRSSGASPRRRSRPTSRPNASRACRWSTRCGSRSGPSCSAGATSPASSPASSRSSSTPSTAPG